MNDFFLYTLKASFCLTVLYLPYALWLRSETFFRLNRSLLLGMLALSLVLPVLRLPSDGITVFPGDIRTAATVGTQTVQLIQLSLHSGVSRTGHTAPLTPADWIVLFYATGAFLTASRQIRQYFLIRRFIRRGNLWKHCTAEGITVCCHARPCPSFSWMRHIVISEKDYREYGREILLHERAHIIYGHSWDALAMAVFRSWQWFNPLVYALAANLRDLHEFEADRAVLLSGTEARHYQLLLLEKNIGTGAFTLADNLKNHNNNLKKRIAMMKKKESSRTSLAKVLYLLPAAAFALLATARPESPNLSREPVSTTRPAQTKNMSTESQTDRLYPDTAKAVTRNVKKDTASAEPLFLINGKASSRSDLQQLKPEQIHEVFILQDKEKAVRTYGPEAQNGIISVTLLPHVSTDPSPIRICPLPGKDGKNTLSIGYSSELIGTEKEPLTVLNGKVISAAEIPAISGNSIVSIYVLKGEKATDAWGSRGKNGVIVMETSLTETDKK